MQLAARRRRLAVGGPIESAAHFECSRESLEADCYDCRYCHSFLTATVRQLNGKCGGVCSLAAHNSHTRPEQTELSATTSWWRIGMSAAAHTNSLAGERLEPVSDCDLCAPLTLQCCASALRLRTPVQLSGAPSGGGRSLSAKINAEPEETGRQKAARLRERGNGVGNQDNQDHEHNKRLNCFQLLPICMCNWTPPSV